MKIKIKKARKAAGLTQVALAAKVGTTQNIISRLENGNYNPTLDFLQRILEPLGYEIGEPKPVKVDISKPNPPIIISPNQPIK